MVSEALGHELLISEFNTSRDGDGIIWYPVPMCSCMFLYCDMFPVHDPPHPWHLWSWFQAVQVILNEWTDMHSSFACNRQRIEIFRDRKE